VPCVCVLLDPGHGHLPLHSGDYMETRLWAALFRSNTTQGRRSRSAVYSRSAGGLHREVGHEPHWQRRAVPSLEGGEACCRAQTSPAET